MDIWDDVTNFFKQAYGTLDYAVTYPGRKFDEYKDKSINFGKSYGVTEGVIDGPLDAYRHTFSSAQSTQDHGIELTYAAGNSNEFVGWVTGRDSQESRQMDIYNNAVGRNLGEKAVRERWSDGRLAYEVKKALDDGLLVSRSKPSGQASLLDYYKK